MDILNQIIISLNKEDIRHFKLLANRTNADKERKDLLFFDYIRQSADNYDEEKIIKKLYGNSDKNTFYRLKNRLIEDIGKSLLMLHCDKQESLHVLNLLSLARYFFSKNNFKPALYYLKKAEKKAIEQENFEILELIYSDFIKLSHETVNINPEIYIHKRQDNSRQLDALKQIDDVLAAVRYRMKVSQNFSEKQNPILQLLQKTINKYGKDNKISQSPKLRFNIYSAVSQVLLQRRDYATLEIYLSDTYKAFSKEGLFNKENHNIKLQMLTYLTNTFFKNKKLNESLKYADKLKAGMEEYSRLLYEKYLFFYHNALVINYSVLDKDKAIKILEELKNNKTLASSTFYGIFIHLNLAVLWFDKKQHKNSIRCLSQLYIHESYKNADISLKLKIAAAELIIRYESGDNEFTEHRIGQVRKEFKELLEKHENEREKELIEIVELMNNTQKLKDNKTLVKKAKNFIQKGNKIGLDDSEIIKYNEWINAYF